MIRQTLKQALWDTYDHLGRLFALNFLMLVTMAPACYFALVFLAVSAQGLALPWRAPFLIFAVPLTMAVLATPWLAGSFRFAELISAEKDPPLAAFFRGIRDRGLAVLRFAIVWTFLVAVLLLNVWFYFFSGRFPARFAWAGYAMGGVCIWLIVLAVMMAMHSLPLVVRRGFRIRQALRVSFLLALKHPGATLGTALFIASLLVIGTALKFVGLVLYGFYAPVILTNSLHDVIVEGESKAAKQPANGAFEKRTSWKEIRNDEHEAEEDRLRRARYERTFRDLLKPWEM